MSFGPGRKPGKDANMKTSRGWAVAGAMAIMAGFAAGRAQAQGPLNPPGPPLASMKTLAQIHAQAVLAEPRTALSAESTPGQSNYVFAVTNPYNVLKITGLAAGPRLVDPENGLRGHAGFGQVEAESLGLQVRDPCRDPVERRGCVDHIAGVHVGHLRFRSHGRDGRKK